MQYTITYDNRTIHPFTKMGDDIIDGELYPDLPRWTGDIVAFSGQNVSVMRLVSNYLPGAPDWNAVYFASHKESDYLLPVVTMEALVYVPEVSFKNGIIIEMNPEIFFSADSPQGNNNIFALFRLIVTEQGMGLRYVGEGDQVYTAVQNIPASVFLPDTWNRIKLSVDFKTQKYLSMEVNDQIYGPELFPHKFTVRPGNGAGSNRSLIGFWIGNKSFQGMSGTPFYVKKLVVTTATEQPPATTQSNNLVVAAGIIGLIIASAYIIKKWRKNK